ncbi:ABC transporter permease [Ruoffia tabacinasalis]|uniref:ABC transporter permease n=1 Tax=Ruoffia tabacinasalis TaxID=87458 RepID=UPI003F94E330
MELNRNQVERKGKFFSSVSFKEYGILVALIVLVVALMIISPTAFAKPQNLINILKQASINGILATGMMFVILTGGIDLSVGSIIALSGVVAAHFAHPDTYPIIVPILLGIGVGVLVGAMNGVAVAYGKIPPFIITLASMMAVRGLALILSGGSPVFGLSKNFENIASSFILGVPSLTVFFVLTVVVAGVILTKTVFGRRVYYIGGNANAANYSGINVERHLVKIYMISGMLAGFAGVLLASRTVQGAPTAGQGYEMDAITAVIVGGISMSGGSGKWYGTIIGALLIAVMSNGLDILGVSSNFQSIIKGIIITVAVFMDLRGKK